MKKLILLIAILLVTVSLFSVPYASKIRVVTSIPGIIPLGSGCTINYFINESGGTVTIEIIKTSDLSVVATFSGTASVGNNAVVWDGTSNNSGGTQVPEGTYRVKLSVSATKSVGWAEIASNSSVGNYVPPANATIYQTLWDGFSGMESLISQNTDKDSFGFILTAECYNSPAVYGHVVFNPDLSCYDGGNGQTTWLNFPGTPPDTPNTSIWGNCFDPDDDNYVWVCGQAGQSASTANNVLYGKWDSLTLTNVTNGSGSLLNARDILVLKQGSDKYAYIARGNSAIWKAKIEGGLISTTTPPINILGLSVTTRYGKGVDVDKYGNLYWSSRYTNSTSGNGGAIHRWSKSQIESAIAGSLTEANAEWEVTLPGSNSEGVAITPDGNVYACCVNEDPTNDGSLRGIYLVGHIDTNPNKKALLVSDRIYPFYGIDYASAFSAYGIGLASDYAGNLYFADRLAEQIRAIGPGGSTNVSVIAPTSQTFSIAVVVSANNWCLFE